jgi:hypothetical protein
MMRKQANTWQTRFPYEIKVMKTIERCVMKIRSCVFYHVCVEGCVNNTLAEEF